MGIIVISAILFGTCWYMAWRLHGGLSALFSRLRFWPVMTLVGTLTLVVALGFARSFLPFSKEIKHILGFVGGYGMAFLLYLLFYTVLRDFLVGILRLIRLPFCKGRLFRGVSAVAVLLLSIGTCVWGFFSAQQISHVRYEVHLEGKRDVSDLRMVLVSDLHLGSLGSEERLETIVAQINAEKPDIICIAGDLFDTDFGAILEPEAAAETLRGLKATYGVFACLGNHDGGKTFGQMLAFMEKANIQLLDDDATCIDNRLVLVGRLDAFSIGGYDGRQRRPMSEVYVGEDASIPVVVMDHNPQRMEEYGNEVDLILSGHTHKGQLFPGNLITDLMYAVDYGHYQAENGLQVIVTSGVGCWGMPVRVGTDCEIVTICFVND